MQWVQTGSNLHGLNLIYSLASGIERTTQVEWWTTIGIIVLDNQILYFFSVYERSCEGVLLGLNIVIVVEAISSQHFLHLLVWTRGNLVNHRPWEGNLLFIFQVVEESCRNQSVLHPALCIGEYASFHLVAIVRAVVHRLYGERQLPSIKALEQQGANLTHCEYGLQTTSQIGLVVGVTLLGDGERNHL